MKDTYNTPEVRIFYIDTRCCLNGSININTGENGGNIIGGDNEIEEG